MTGMRDTDRLGLVQVAMAAESVRAAAMSSQKSPGALLLDPLVL